MQALQVSDKSPHVFFDYDKQRWFWEDEVGWWGNEAGCATEAQALRELRAYGKWLNGYEEGDESA